LAARRPSRASDPKALLDLAQRPNAAIELRDSFLVVNW
jgi:hypothetical protein